MKKFYKILSILSMLFGVVLILDKDTNISGAIVANKTLSYQVMILWGTFFLIMGITLYYLQNKEK